ncbi:MAG: hypothetical protein PVJ19_03110 [Desulfobacteraceae bacterium]
MTPWIHFSASTAIFSWFNKGVEGDALKILLTPVDAPHAAAFFSEKDFVT